MNLAYYQLLTSSYLAAVGVWWLLSKRFPETFLPKEEVVIAKPWIQVAILVICAVVTVAIGQAYVHGYLFPDFRIGSCRWRESLNQILIYSPFPLFLLVHKQSLASAWLPQRNFALRLGMGLLLSILALVVFALLANKKPVSEVALNVFHLQNMHHFVQVFFEDFAIALLLSRLSAAFKPNYFVGGIFVVAILFPLAHLPGNLAAGVPLLQALASLSLDAMLVFIVGFALFKSKDFLWFFPIHFVMDMMQFYSGLSL